MKLWKYVVWSFFGWFTFYYSFEVSHKEWLCALAVIYLMLVAHVDGRATERKEKTNWRY